MTNNNSKIKHYVGEKDLKRTEIKKNNILLFSPFGKMWQLVVCFVISLNNNWVYFIQSLSYLLIAVQNN